MRVARGLISMASSETMSVFTRLGTHVNGIEGTATTRSAELWERWGHHLAIAAAYAAVYEVARHLSFPQWMATAGLRLACLLLMPVRYWPALAVGEGVPLIETAALCAPDLGAAWALSECVPMILLWMALLKPMRRRWSLHDARGRLRMAVILSAALGTAIITAVATLLTTLTAIIHSPTGAWPDPDTGWVGYLFAYLLGAYLGALTLTPAVLALRERYRALGSTPLTLRRVWRSALLRDVLGWVLPILAVMTWLAVRTHDDALRQAARIALIFPVLGLAWRHGWHGTAVGGMTASVALAATAPDLMADPATLQVQAILALVLSGTLLVGVRGPTRAVGSSARAHPGGRGRRLASPDR